MPRLVRSIRKLTFRVSVFLQYADQRCKPLSIKRLSIKCRPRPHIGTAGMFYHNSLHHRRLTKRPIPNRLEVRRAPYGSAYVWK